MVRIVKEQSHLYEDSVPMLPMEFVQRFNKYPVNDVTYTTKGTVFGSGNNKGVLNTDNRYIMIQFSCTFIRLQLSHISSILQTTQTSKFQSFWITMNDKSQITFRVLT